MQHNRAHDAENSGLLHHSALRRENRLDRSLDHTLGLLLVSFHLLPRLLPQTSSNLCNRICNCFNAVYSRLLTVLSGKSSTSAISRNVSSSNSFIITTCRNSSGRLFIARRTAAVSCRPSARCAGE